VVSPPRSQLRRTTWYTALALASALLLLLPQPPPARAIPADLPADDTPPIVSYSIDGIVGTNDWFRGSSGGHYIVLHWTVTDPEGGIIETIGCEPAIRIDSPNTGTRRTCTATSGGGTTSVTTRLLKVDAEPPTTTAGPSRPPNSAGWYRASLSISWSGTDATSGIASCRSPLSYSGPDTAGTDETGSCTDNAGNSSSATFTVRYDTHPPTTTATPSRPPNAAGWYRASVRIDWNASPGDLSGIASCSPSITYSGPDTPGTDRTGSCTDNAGNSSSDTFTVRYDTLAPTVNAPTPVRVPDHNGWYNHAVRIDWSGIDAMSGIASCTSLTYSGPDGAGASVGGTCSDRAGNVATARNFGLDYDATAPATTVMPARSSPDHNGWYNHSLQISWSGNDATSGIDSCSAPVTYRGPDSSNASSTGSCTDIAGNSSSRAFSFSYDDTAPTTVATPSPLPNANGWFRAPLSIHWSGNDATSGIDSCSAALAYGGPDTTGTDETGSCTDNAGNSSTATFRVKYDTVAPTTVAAASPLPNANGWSKAPVTITWSGSDATSGIDSCRAPLAYSGPDTLGTSVNGSCSDRAGNSSSDSLVVKYDATDPVVAVTAARSPDHDGWYNHPVAISWSGRDVTSGIASCSAPITYSGPDRSDASSVGRCTDRAGNSASPPPLSFKYDATAPATAAVPSRPPDANGWYNHLLPIYWLGSDPVSGIASCTSLAYGGPDAARASRSGSCTDKAGNSSGTVAFGFRYDATAPGGIAVSAERPADHDGWYNHPLAVRWSGSDALAGIASCTSLTYGGPNTTGVALAGRCTDRAGNTSASLAFPLKYDQTPPTFKALALKALDGVVKLRWRLLGATNLLILRSPGPSRSPTSALYNGPGTAFVDRRVENYVRYRYTLTAADAAGNTSARTAFATPKPDLFAPRPGARLGTHASPLFAWRPVPKARYYNLQLWSDGRKVGSWWPSRARLRLPSHWQYRGKQRRLEPGSYAWYVWPGRGARRLGRYGPLLGKSTFVVR
jgi:hypothetical protein